MNAALDAGLDADAAAALVDDEDELDAEAESVSASQRAEFLAVIEEANREPSEAEAARIHAAFERRQALKDAHPLSIAAREYALIAHGLLPVLRPMLEERGDPLLLAGVETIERFASLIAVKTRRALESLVTRGDDDDEWDDEEFMESDGNGSAKLVRLVIAESREAWSVLMQVGSAAADGVPAAMVRRLEALDRELAVAFPRAMAFVRAGFDEGA